MHIFFSIFSFNFVIVKNVSCFLRTMRYQTNLAQRDRNVKLSLWISRRPLQTPTTMADIDWETINSKLPYEKTPEEKEKRNEMWTAIDINGNGYASLAEITKVGQRIFQFQYLFVLFQFCSSFVSSYLAWERFGIHSWKGLKRMKGWQTENDVRYSLLIYGTSII